MTPLVQIPVTIFIRVLCCESDQYVCTAAVWDKDRTDHVPIACTLVPGQQFVRNSAKFM